MFALAIFLFLIFFSFSVGAFTLCGYTTNDCAAVLCNRKISNVPVDTHTHKRTRKQQQTSANRTVDRLWSITEDLNILYKENWTRLAAQEVQQFQVSIEMNELTVNVSDRMARAGEGGAGVDDNQG